MDTQTTQPETVNSGASNAADFQPPTQNPQNPQTNLFQQQGGLQDMPQAQDVLREQQNFRIVLPQGEPNQPPRPAEGQAGLSATTLFAIVLIGAILLALAHGYRRSAKRRGVSSEETVESDTSETDVIEPKEPKTRKKSARKHGHGRPKSQKKKKNR
jgi:hypothetical protein